MHSRQTFSVEEFSYPVRNNTVTAPNHLCPRMQRILHLALALSCTLLLPSLATAQQAVPTTYSPRLQQDLQRIGAAASALIQTMPSFTCDETALSQAIRDHEVVRSMNLTGTVRTIRQPDGRIVETYDYQHKHILLFIPKPPPLFVRGGFATALAYFLPAAQPCYRYSLSSGRIDFETRTDPAIVHACTQRGMKGFALLSPNGNVSHIERTIPPDVANPLNLATYASVDLAPVGLNGTTYQLSQHLVAEMPLHDATGHFEATYTHCHLFTATVTVGPATEIPPADSTNPH